MTRTTILTTIASMFIMPTTVFAVSITGWNTFNVAVPAVNPPDGVQGESVIFDRVPPTAAGAVTDGKIVFTPPEGVLPGITVENGAYTFGPASATPTGCIRASAATTCDGPRMSGKRLKQVATGSGPIDLVFDVDPDGVQDPDGDPDVGYRVYHRLINGTGTLAQGFALSLGEGVGSDFTRSTAADGLGFSKVGAYGDPSVNTQPPAIVSESAFYPFGLFGDATTNPNFDLGGFFDPTGRAGFNLSATDDMLTSDGFFGAYESLFGGWLSQDQVPDGGFWDNDDDSSTEALLMAWLRPDGLWEARREVVDLDAGIAGTLETPVTAPTFEGIAATLGLADLLLEGGIEDLANLNVNFSITLAKGFAGDSMTLRSSVAPIPLPATAPLLFAGLGLLCAAARRRPVPA